MLEREIKPVRFTPCEIGHAIGQADNWSQRGVLMAWADEIHAMGAGNWAIQCRAIVDGHSDNAEGLTPSDRQRIAAMLGELVDHLSDSDSSSKR